MQRLAAVMAMLTILAVGAGCGPAPQAAAPLRPGASLPDSAISDLQGRTLELDQLRGTPLLINVWETWCKPCQEEVPVLSAAYRRYPKLRIAAVDLSGGETGAGAVARFVHEHAVPYPVYKGGGDLPAALGIQAIPTSIFVDARGVVRDVVVGPLSADVIATQLAALQGGGAGA